MTLPIDFYIAADVLSIARLQAPIMIGDVGGNAPKIVASGRAGVAYAGADGAEKSSTWLS